MHTKFVYRKEAFVALPSKSIFNKNIRKRGFYKYLLLKIIEFTILILIIIGLARPKKIESLEEALIDIIDILLVLDISSSMLADDFEPNRLEVVKSTAKNFVSSRLNDRMGIIVFAGQSFIQCPLTVDSNVLNNLIDEISVVDREFDGTAIGMAIANGTNRLRDSESKSKVMILLSDGSNNAGEIDPITAAKIAKQFGIKIYTIAVGTNQSFSRIPGRGLTKNEIDIETLQKISFETNGEFYRATDQRALENIYNEIDALERSKIEIKNHTKYQELYGWLLIPAVFLSFFYIVIRKYIFRMRM